MKKTLYKKKKNQIRLQFENKLNFRTNVRQEVSFNSRTFNGINKDLFLFCLYDKSKMLYKERDVNRNAWSKVGEKLNFRQNMQMQT